SYIMSRPSHAALHVPHSVGQAEAPALVKTTGRHPSTWNDARRLERRALYLGEGLKVRLHHEKQQVEGEAVDLTPEGMGVAIPTGTVQLRPGDRVTIEHTGRVLAGHRQSAIVRHVSEGTFGRRRIPRVGLALVREHTRPGSRDQRKTERYA